MSAAIAGQEQPLADLESRRRHVGWALALRGVVAMIFGLVALRSPGAAAGAFVIFFAVFAFAEAILELFAASAFGRMGYRWGWYLLAAIVSIATGIFALAYPHATLLVVVLLVGARAILTGMLELGAAFSWRELDSRWLLGLVGALSVVLGILLFASPTAGGLALLWTVGIYAIVLGSMLLVLGVRVGRSERDGSATIGNA